jgi:hypothetical protein
MYFKNYNSKNFPEKDFLKFAASPEKLQKTDLDMRNKYNNSSKIFSKIEKGGLNRKSGLWNFAISLKIKFISMSNRQIDSDRSACGQWTRNVFGSSGAENLVTNLDPVAVKRIVG